MNKNKVKLLIGTFVIHRILLETLLLDPVNTISRQINDENVRNIFNLVTPDNPCFKYLKGTVLT